MIGIGSIFIRTLKDHRQAIFWWGIGLGAMGLLVIAVYPMMEDMAFMDEAVRQMMEMPLFSGMFGDLADMDYTSPEGFLGMEFFTWTPLLLAVYAVMFGLGIVGNEEARGTLDTLLSTPIRRWRVIVEKSAAFIVAMMLVLLIMAACMIASILILQTMEISLNYLMQAILATLPMLMVIGAITMFLTTLIRRRNIAAAIASLVLVVSYFISTFGQITTSSVLDAIDTFSLYAYYSPQQILLEGINWGDSLLLFAVSVVFFAMSIFFFERRDIYE